MIARRMTSVMRRVCLSIRRAPRENSCTTACSRRGLPAMIESTSSTEAHGDINHRMMLSRDVRVTQSTELLVASPHPDLRRQKHPHDD
jgi:hypothetical protein